MTRPGFLSLLCADMASAQDKVQRLLKVLIADQRAKPAEQMSPLSMVAFKHALTIQQFEVCRCGDVLAVNFEPANDSGPQAPRAA